MNNIKRKIDSIGQMGLKNSAKLCRDRVVARFVPKYIEKKWNKHRRDYRGLSKKRRAKPLIFSLTSYPGRIDTVHLVIRSLLCQTVKPDMIVLWLAKEQFPNKEMDLPEDLLTLKSNGLTIDWCDDIGPYKKLIPTIKKYPDSFIITFDDDQYYLPSIAERLYRKAVRDQKKIYCHRGTKIAIDNNRFVAVPGGYITYKGPTFLHKPTGCCGVCYPPDTLYKDLANEELFMKLSPTNDDIWFWFMGVLQGTKCDIINNNLPGLFMVQSSQTDSLHSINDEGEQLFWRDFNAIIEHYPELEDVLKNEYNQIMGGYER